ncbi:MAG: glutathione S-transferase family protein [Alcanivorax sp.]|jgi:glutathione S-transferase|nr:glutathione S-transferase family protein [Alcanivorax sp.]
MLTLHGFDASNYVNMVKFALREKGLEFEQATLYPSQEETVLGVSPMGKVPVLETGGVFLSETNVILEYLDDTAQGPALYPADPLEKAQVKQLAKHIELYLELPARRCYPEVFFGGQVSDETKEQTREALLKGIRGLARKARWQPFLAGDQLTAADVFFLYSADLAKAVAGKLFGIDLLAEAPGSAGLLARLNQRDSAQSVAAERDLAMEKFLKYARGGK